MNLSGAQDFEQACSTNPSLFGHPDYEEPIEPLLTVATEEISALLREEGAYAQLESAYDENLLDDGVFDAVDTRILNRTYTTILSSHADSEKIAESAKEDDDKSTISGTTTYLNSIDRFSLLKHEEVIDLARRIKKGDEQALEILVRANLKLVINVIKRMFLSKTKYSMKFDDLVQEGNIGLMHAAVKFDPERGYKFSTYAVFWIRQKISRAYTNKAFLISVPTHVGERIYKAKRQLDAAIKNNDENIAELKGLYEKTIDDHIPGQLHMLQEAQGIGSLDSSGSSDPSMPTLAESIADAAQDPTSRLEILQCIELMRKALNSIHNPVTQYVFKPTASMTQKEIRANAKNEKRELNRLVFELHSGLNEDLESVSFNDIVKLPGMNITRECARQIYMKARITFEEELIRLAGGYDNLPYPIPLNSKTEKKLQEEKQSRSPRMTR